MNRKFDLSIVIPMDDDHGYGEACVESWNSQTVSRDRLQLVIVDLGEDRKFNQRIRQQLSPQDVMVTVDTDNEGLLYERGARACEAELLLMTEGHCIAERGAAEEVICLFEDSNVAAINMRSSHLEPTIIARQQSLLEEKWISEWPPGHWRTISLRGFAVRRGIYERLGGFQPSYRRFCVNAFAIELDRQGLRLIPSRASLVRHGNAPTVTNVASSLRDSARGQIEWRARLRKEKPPDLGDRYLGGLDFWSRRGDLESKTARALAGSLLRSILADVQRVGGLQKAKHGVAELPRLWSAMMVGPRASAVLHRIALAWAMLVCGVSRLHRRWLFHSYLRLWRLSFDSGYADFVVSHRVEPQWIALEQQKPVDVASLPDGSVAGLRAREKWGTHGPFMRWSGSVFLLRLQLSREEPRRLIFDVRCLLPPGQRCLSAFLNGVSLAQSALTEEEEKIVINLPSELYQANGCQDLIITCRAVRPSESGEADRRRLGLALFTIKSE